MSSQAQPVSKWTLYYLTLKNRASVLSGSEPTVPSEKPANQQKPVNKREEKPREAGNQQAKQTPAPKKGDNADGGKGKKKGRKTMVLKTPKGTRDYDPIQMAIREKVFNTIINIYKTFGAVTIETPLFELKETLTNKYGEDSKLIYDLQDQGGELCSLRYDLTVPFARYLAMNRIQVLKRYHIGRVYRRDQPSPHQGRWREFYQCDFDIAGTFEPLVADAEILSAAVTVLKSLEIGNFVVKLNNRKLLDGIFAICDVPADKFRTICSSVDKLDKLPWDEVKKEMLTKGLEEAKADRIWEFVQLNGRPLELLGRIKSQGLLGGNRQAEEALSELETLFELLDSFGVLDYISFDLSLARGLDYYTGIIFEAVTLDNKGLGVGSIAGGGRYDGLVEQFGGEKVPCIGFSIGVERIFALLEAIEANKQAHEKTKSCPTQVMVCSISNAKDAHILMKERIRLVSQLRAGGIPAEFLPKKNPKIDLQLRYASERYVPFAIIFGGSEFENKTVKVKNLYARTEEVIPVSNVVEYIKDKLSTL